MPGCCDGSQCSSAPGPALDSPRWRRALWVALAVMPVSSIPAVLLAATGLVGTGWLDMIVAAVTGRLGSWGGLADRRSGQARAAPSATLVGVGDGLTRAAVLLGRPGIRATAYKMLPHR